MVIELLLIFLVIVGFFVMMYKSAITEYTILQEDYHPDDDLWKKLLSEKSPLVIRNIPESWSGIWNYESTKHTTWPVVTKKDGQTVRTGWKNWIHHPVNDDSVEPTMIMNSEEISNVARFDEIASSIKSDIGKWTMLNGLTKTDVVVLPPVSERVYGLKKTTAEATLFVSTDGTPARIWLAHSGITEKLPKYPEGMNPWKIGPSDTPWLSEMKYIEMKLRPGTAIILPPHWWIAIRPELPVISEKPIFGEGSWIWSAEFNSPVSWLAGRLKRV